MKVNQIIVSGLWAHFRRPETNNNPITYDFMPKTAFIGMLASICGLNKRALKKEYEHYSKTTFYNIQILNDIKKIATSFRIYKYKGSLTSVENPPQFYELLKDVKFKISFYGENDLISDSIKSLSSSKSCFTPTLGLINCPANIKYLGENIFITPNDKTIKTKGIVPFECNVNLGGNITYSYDNIPIVQNSEWQNIEYKKVFYAFLPSDKIFQITDLNFLDVLIDDQNEGYFFI